MGLVLVGKYGFGMENGVKELDCCYDKIYSAWRRSAYECDDVISLYVIYDVIG